MPTSKSETNRAFIIQALSTVPIDIHNASTCSDSLILKKLLEQIHNYQREGNFSDYICLDVGSCGTAMRFLTSYLSIQKGQYVLSGDTRMEDRPIGPLVDVLSLLGANIKYASKFGFPPLIITGVELLQQVDDIKVDSSLTSQYLSSLVLIAPCIKNGIKITLPKFITSKPYLEMTLDIMRQAGIFYSISDNYISIDNQEYKKSDISINADWSSASYWYSIAALSNQATIIIKNLNIASKQADKAVVDIMSEIGVATTYRDSNIIITKSGNRKSFKTSIIDFTNYPDLAQTIIPCFAMLDYKVKFTGLHTLKIKETDRIQAIKNELKKLNYNVASMPYSLKTYYSHKNLSYLQCHNQKGIIIDTYKDHRMAMAFAPLALKLGGISIKDEGVVVKSYPEFWEDLKKIFIIH